MFLPDGQTQSSQTGVTNFSPGTQQTTQEDVALMQRVLEAAAQNPLMIPPDLMSYILDYIQTSRLIIPIGQVFGFSGFTFQAAPTILTNEATSLTAYGDLTTAGPLLTGIPDGSYAIFFGAQLTPTTPSQAVMSLGVTNIAAASDDDSVVVSAGSISSTRLVVKTLTGNAAGVGNQLRAQYRSTGGESCSFSRRWLVAVKFANV